MPLEKIFRSLFGKQRKEPDVPQEKGLLDANEVSKVIKDDLVSKLGKEDQDILKTAVAIFQLARFVNPGSDAQTLERLQKEWATFTNNGQVPSTELFEINAEVAYFQKYLEEIMNIKKDSDSCLLYLPGSAGMIRVNLFLEDSVGQMELADNGGDRVVSERYNQLSFM